MRAIFLSFEVFAEAGTRLSAMEPLLDTCGELRFELAALPFSIELVLLIRSGDILPGDPGPLEDNEDSDDPFTLSIKFRFTAFLEARLLPFKPASFFDRFV